MRICFFKNTSILMAAGNKHAIAGNTLRNFIIVNGISDKKDIVFIYFVYAVGSAEIMDWYYFLFFSFAGGLDVGV